MLIHRMHFPADLNLSAILGDGMCRAPHWGTLLEGELHAHYSDGTEEVVEAGAVYHLRPRHTLWFDTETTVLEVSPARETLEVFEKARAAYDRIMAPQI